MRVIAVLVIDDGNESASLDATLDEGTLIGWALSGDAVAMSQALIDLVDEVERLGEDDESGLELIH